MELANNLKKRFVKDFKLPINVLDEPYFSYFKELYESNFKIEEKLVWLEQAIEQAGSVEEFFILGKSISDNIKEMIKSSNAYQTFNTIDVNKTMPLEVEVKQQNIYISPNVGKQLISIDLEKANFNCLDLFDLKKELNVQSYEKLIETQTNLEYYKNSKMIRQVIFGDLNPSRQQRIQKYIINQFCSLLLKAGCELSSASSDEIIIKNEISTEEIKEILKDVNPKFKFFRVEPFKFDRIDPEYEYFVKVTETQKGEKIEFKNVPGHFFAQVYKRYLGLEINEYDMLFYHEEKLAQFKEPVFKNTIVKTNKIKI